MKHADGHAVTPTMGLFYALCTHQPRNVNPQKKSKLRNIIDSVTGSFASYLILQCKVCILQSTIQKLQLQFNDLRINRTTALTQLMSDFSPNDNTPFLEHFDSNDFAESIIALMFPSKNELFIKRDAQSLLECTWYSRNLCRTGMRDVRSAYKNLVGKPEGKTPHDSPRCTLEDNIKKNTTLIFYFFRNRI
jgi:hypothetical protein